MRIMEPCEDTINIQTMTTMLMGYKRPEYLAKIGRIPVSYTHLSPMWTRSRFRHPVNLWSVKINGMEGSRHNETESIGLYSGLYSRVGNP